MSYSQILRRINRLLKASVNDFMDTLSKDEQDLHDFDEELRDASGERQSGKESDSARGGGAQGRSAGATGAGRAGTRSGGQSRGGSGSQRKEGRRKPGERDDAYYFGILGITPNATEAEIKKAYRDLMRQYHPDRVSGLGPELQETASRRAQEINEAYHIIERRRGFK